MAFWTSTTKATTTTTAELLNIRIPWTRGWHCAMSSERDSFAKGNFSTFAKGFLLHKLLLKANYSPLRVKKSRSHDMGQYQLKAIIHLILKKLTQSQHHLNIFV
jgi:hypothetical protein